MPFFAWFVLFPMNKKHWNTILPEDNVLDDLIKQWIDNFYKLVVKNLTNKDIEWLNQLD